MKRFAILIALTGLLTQPVWAEECVLTLELRESNLSLNPFKHIRNKINKVRFKLPVDCQFYEEVEEDQDLLEEDNFKFGSLLVGGDVAHWHLEVVDKEITDFYQEEDD